MKIAVCGKGGSGKSTVVALLASAAQAVGYRVVVVDSDESNSGLFRMLGFEHPPVPLLELLGGKSQMRKNMTESNLFIRDEIAPEDIPGPHIVQRDALMLVSIGKILQSLEGCACPMGVLSREFLKKLSLRQGEVAVVDMEAGVEHFGRGVESSVDSVLIVVEPPRESLDIGRKIYDLASGVGVKHTWAVLNKVPSAEISARLRAELERQRIDVVGCIGFDEGIFSSSIEGDVPKDGAAAQQVKQVLTRILASAGAAGEIR